MSSTETPAQHGPIGRFRTVTWLASTGSTNADAVAVAREQEEVSTEAFVILADTQTAGRGRRDRSWEMPSGHGLLLSFFVPWPDRETVHAVPMAVGIAMVESVASVGCGARLKWPNDLVAAGGDEHDLKLAGMLSEIVHSSSSYGSGQPATLGVVVGCGINVSWPAVGEVEHATCIDRVTGAPTARAALAFDLIARTDAELIRAERQGFTAVLDRYRQRCATLGRRVRIEHADRPPTIGVATDVDAEARLVVDSDGVIGTIDVGDVVHLRPGTTG